MAVLDVAGFVADLKDHAVEHGFHVHDERHFVESYSLRQTWEVDVHPEEGCEGPVDLYLSLEIDPRVLLGFEDAVINLPDDDEPADDVPLPAELHVGAAAAATGARPARARDRARRHRRARPPARGVGDRLVPERDRRPRAHAAHRRPPERLAARHPPRPRRCRARRSNAVSR